MTVDDFNDIAGTTLPQNRAHTLAGVVFDALGRRPQAGDRVIMEGTELTVRELAGSRIERLQVEPAR